MEQLKFALGPYEIFASIIGGSPLVLAIFLICNPFSNLQDIFLAIKNNLSIPVALLIAFFSYILGGSIQGITWKYFLLVCKFFRQDYSYFGSIISQKSTLLMQSGETQAASSLEFEDKLVILLQEKVGIPKNLDWLNARLTAYLKECNSQAVITAESYLANHIMYRNISFCFLLLPIVLLINLLRTRLLTSEQPVLILLFLLISYMTFFRSVSFKKWHNRELLLGFYFSASNRM
ncbi:hypothetical protein [Almyronema epifaneia]|uniref:Uncharacterized protein n=1 Tax=Almyronema epifaneia S1 TaxID=2991925 RepID=A0ABW6I986_9CYAN